MEFLHANVDLFHVTSFILFRINFIAMEFLQANVGLFHVILFVLFQINYILNKVRESGI